MVSSSFHMFARFSTSVTVEETMAQSSGSTMAFSCGSM